jgi:hypothetical protein
MVCHDPPALTSKSMCDGFETVPISSSPVPTVNNPTTKSTTKATPNSMFFISTLFSSIFHKFLPDGSTAKSTANGVTSGVDKSETTKPIDIDVSKLCDPGKKG